MPRLPTSVTCAFIVLAAAARADAATVTYDRACYSPGEPIVQTGAGFTPGGSVFEAVTLIDGTDILATLIAPPAAVDAAGGFTRTLVAPALAREGDRRETAMSTFTDQALPPDTPPTIAQWSLSGWDAELWSRRIGVGQMMEVDTWGWTSRGDTLYGHWYRRGKRAHSGRIGRLSAPCGDLRRSVRQFPFRRPKPGRWTLYLSATPRLNRADDPWISFGVRLGKPKRAARTAALLRSIGRSR